MHVHIERVCSYSGSRIRMERCHFFLPLLRICRLPVESRTKVRIWFLVSSPRPSRISRLSPSPAYPGSTVAWLSTPPIASSVSPRPLTSTTIWLRKPMRRCSSPRPPPTPPPPSPPTHPPSSFSAVFKNSTALAPNKVSCCCFFFQHVLPPLIFGSSSCHLRLMETSTKSDFSSATPIIREMALLKCHRASTIYFFLLYSNTLISCGYRIPFLGPTHPKNLFPS